MGRKKEFNPFSIDRVLARVEMDPFGGCWLWTGHISESGYANARFDGRRVTVSRRVLETKVGHRLAADRFACHTCNVRCCVNPDHLYEGDALTNAADAVRAGSYEIRKRKPNRAVLDATQVAQIFLSADMEKQLASDFGVSVTTVRDIKMQKRWAEVTKTLGPPRGRLRMGRERGFRLSKPKRDYRHARNERIRAASGKG